MLCRLQHRAVPRGRGSIMQCCRCACLPLAEYMTCDDMRCGDQTVMLAAEVDEYGAEDEEGDEEGEEGDEEEYDSEDSGTEESGQLTTLRTVQAAIAHLLGPFVALDMPDDCALLHQHCYQLLRFLGLRVCVAWDCAQGLMMTRRQRMRQTASWQMSRTQMKTDRTSRRQSTTTALCRRQRYCRSKVHDSRMLQYSVHVDHRQSTYILSLSCKILEYTCCIMKSDVGTSQHV